MANLQAFERSEYQQVKADLHRKILDRLDLEKLGRTSGDSAREEVLILIRNSVNSEAVPLSFAEREQLSREILDEIFGLGPLEPLLKDPTISDILVNRFDRVYVERAGKLEITGLSFKDNQHLMQIIDRIVSRIGRRHVIDILPELAAFTLGIDAHESRHAQMHHQRFTAVERGQKVFGAARELLDLVAFEACRKTLRKGLPEIAAPRFDFEESMAFENRLKAHLHGFDFGQFGHEILSTIGG